MASDGIMQEQCPHIDAILTDDALKNGILAKYKSVIAWNVNRLQEAKHVAKRRKVRFSFLT